MPGFKPKAYLGNGRYIFVSYSHKDSERVNEFIAILQTKYNVWFDEGIHFGKEWDEEIVAKIDGCSLFVFAITENSLNSQNCKDEIVFAKENGIPFINVLFDDIELPKIFRFRYGRIQMLKYFEYADKSKVLEDLVRRSEDIGKTKKDDFAEALKEEDKAPKEEIRTLATPKQESGASGKDYALFVFEKEITIFSINGEEREGVINGKLYFDDDGERVYRLVLLPGESMNSPVNLVEITEVSMLDKAKKSVMGFRSLEPMDARYSHNVLNRGYNCINVDFKTDKDMPFLLTKVETIKLKTRIHSIFGSCLDVEFEVLLNGLANVEYNPDRRAIPDLTTFKIHHCHYKVIRT